MDFDLKNYRSYTRFIEEYTGQTIGERLYIELPYDKHSHSPAFRHICYTWLGILDHRFILDPHAADEFYKKQLYTMNPRFDKHSKTLIYSLCLEKLYTEMLFFYLKGRDEAAPYLTDY